MYKSPMTISKDSAAAKVLGRIPSGVFILTLAKEEIEAALLTSWVTQASFDPPMITVAIGKSRAIRELLVQEQKFALNILAEGETKLFKYFAKGIEPGLNRFQGVEHYVSDQGCIVLRESLGYLSCEVSNAMAGGDHDIILATVVGGELFSTQEPRVHIRKSGFSY